MPSYDLNDRETLRKVEAKRRHAEQDEAFRRMVLREWQALRVQPEARKEPEPDVVDVDFS
jgi:hypothetical protein